jgi:hypothetical protein
VRYHAELAAPRTPLGGLDEHVALAAHQDRVRRELGETLAELAERVAGEQG